MKTWALLSLVTGLFALPAAAAAPLWVVTITAPDAAIQRQLMEVANEVAKKHGASVFDATSIRAGLRPHGMLGVEIPMSPSGLSDALSQSWSAGRAACTANMGDLSGGVRKPGMASQLGAGADCARMLEQGTWNRFLKEKKAERVLEILFSADPAKIPFVSVETYVPSEATITRHETKPATRVDQAARDAIGAALSASPTGRRSASTELPSAPSASLPELNQKPVSTNLPAVPVPAGCTIPSKLQLSPGDSHIAQTLAARWSRSAGAKGNGKSISCAMTASKGHADGLVPTDTLMVMLDCDGHQHRAEVAWSTMTSKDPVDLLTSRLIQSVVTTSCAK